MRLHVHSKRLRVRTCNRISLCIYEYNNFTRIGTLAKPDVVGVNPRPPCVSKKGFAFSQDNHAVGRFGSPRLVEAVSRIPSVRKVSGRIIEGVNFPFLRFIEIMQWLQKLLAVQALGCFTLVWILHRRLTGRVAERDVTSLSLAARKVRSLAVHAI